MLAAETRRELWRFRRLGTRAEPAFEYLVAQRRAVNAIARQEGHTPLPELLPVTI